MARVSVQSAEYIAACKECVRDQPKSVEPLITSELPQLPWQKVDGDVLKYNNVNYLIVVGYADLLPMTSMTALAVVQRLTADHLSVVQSLPVM